MTHYLEPTHEAGPAPVTRPIEPGPHFEPCAAALVANDLAGPEPTPSEQIRGAQAFDRYGRRLGDRLAE